jgi:hypothetical protein
MSWVDVGLAAGFLASVAFIAYVWLKNRELARTIMEEKNAILEKVIPVVEAVIPILPPDKQPVVREAADALKAIVEIDRALMQVPLSQLYKAWRRLRFEKLK